ARKLCFVTLPFVVGICFATVYIKAHYLVDVIAGMISAPVCIVLSRNMYTKLLTYQAYGEPAKNL
ncbi:MAG: phosphatase PAP2 family protein, partial [Bacteroidia bacterium]|nr:phosphatase PAP2 family protein [Bacteroidia bacterium]